jgi:hypothetical protein
MLDLIAIQLPRIGYRLSPEEPDNKRQHHTQEEARYNWKVKTGVLAAHMNIAWQPAQAQRQIPTNTKQ